LRESADGQVIVPIFVWRRRGGGMRSAVADG